MENRELVTIETPEDKMRRSSLALPEQRLQSLHCCLSTSHRNAIDFPSYSIVHCLSALVFLLKHSLLQHHPWYAFVLRQSSVRIQSDYILQRNRDFTPSLATIPINDLSDSSLARCLPRHLSTGTFEDQPFQIWLSILTQWKLQWMYREWKYDCLWKCWRWISVTHMEFLGSGRVRSRGKGDFRSWSTGGADVNAADGLRWALYMSEMIS